MKIHFFSQCFFSLSVVLSLNGCKSSGVGGDSNNSASSYADFCAKSVGTTQGSGGDDGQSGEISYSWIGDANGSKVGKRAKLIYNSGSGSHFINVYDSNGDIDDVTIRVNIPLNIQSQNIPGVFVVTPGSSAVPSGKNVALALAGALNGYRTDGYDCSAVSGKTYCVTDITSLHDSGCTFSFSEFDYQEYDPDLYKGAFVVSGTFSCEIVKKVSNWPSSNDELLTTELSGTFEDICLPEIYAPTVGR